MVYFFMLIEIIHVNGKYYPDKGVHSTPDKLSADYYPALASKLLRAANRGATLLYRPNPNIFYPRYF